MAGTIRRVKDAILPGLGARRIAIASTTFEIIGTPPLRLLKNSGAKFAAALTEQKNTGC
ncbi:MAG TPA: hypothetical protein VGH22_18405 [Candidatus Binatia bacterium]|jgi:hypothetical protein